MSRIGSVLSREVEIKLDDKFGTVRLRHYPDIAIGPHCDDPYPCPLHYLCGGHLTDDNPTTPYRGTRKGFRLLADGVCRLGNIPDDFKLIENQTIQRRASLTGKPLRLARPLRVPL